MFSHKKFPKNVFHKKMKVAANLCVISFVRSQAHAENQFVESNDLVLPDQLVERDDALVDEAGAAGFTELTDKHVAERAKVGRQLFRTDSL